MMPKKMKTAIVGLGYVGLPLSLQFARSGATVLGLDIDETKVKALNAGQSFIKHIAPELVAEVVKAGRFSAHSDFKKVKEVEAVIICVPTPLNKNREPDISFILETGKAIAPYLQKGTLVVLESTTYPGTTDEDLRAVLEAGSKLKAGTDFHLAYSPEREDPGNAHSKVELIPKVIGGHTPECLERAIALYGRAIKSLVPVSSCRVAEATKLLENIYRSVNIALVNELKIVYGAMGIDVWEVINAAKTKPFGFMPFYPGPGLGGHCIPIDPYYLSWKAREYDFATRFIELAGEVNTAMPYHVVDAVAAALNEHKKSMKGSKILLLGMAYKKDVDDLRESPSLKLLELLTGNGALLDYNDPYFPALFKMRHYDFSKMRSVELTPQGLAKYDCVLIATDHSSYDYNAIVQHSKLVVDSRNATRRVTAHREKIAHC